MINIGAEDYNVLKQQYIKKYIRLELLDFQYNIVDELSGNMTKCSINVDSNSDLRRSCDLSFVVTTSTFDIKAGSKIFLDKMVRPYVGYENMRTGEIQWYNQGIYLVNNPQWSYNASTNEISMQALDLMSKLTGLRNGNLEGIPTVIAKDENVREAIISTLALGGFTKYVCEECKTNDGTIVPVPYDIEIDVGGTVYDILSSLRDIMPNYQIYFDINGVFHYEPIPLAYDDPVLIDDDLWPDLLISESINTDFESVKNYVEVLGHTWDVDYYSPSDKTTVNGGTITPTFADLKELQNDTAVGITLPSDVEVGGSGTSILPDGYTQLEYIQSSGTQYIDTGFIPNQNTRVVVDAKPLNVTQAIYWCIFGVRTNIYFELYKASTSTMKLTFLYNLTYSQGFDSVDYAKRQIFEINKNVATVDGNSLTYPVQTFQQTRPLFLLATNNNGVANGIAASQLYSAKIYDNDTIVRDFVPCKNPDGVVGLYDLVNSQFYQNAGTGSFTAGTETPSVIVDKITINYLGNNDVVDIDDKPIKELSKDTEWIFQFVSGPKLPSGYTELEYIQSSGTQYIDTGFKPGGNTKVVIDFYAYNQSTAQQGIFGGRTNTTGGLFSLLTGISTSSLQADYDTIQSLENINNTISGLDLTKRVVISMSNELVINGSSVTSVDIKTFTSAQNMYLFANNNGGTLQLPSSLYLYSCMIYDHDTLVRNFIPCKNSVGTVGLYDTTNGVFYQNAGSGSFTAGPEVEREDKGGPFWRFMGHQQAQALSYDNNPSSPFYVGDPIGSSSVGRIRVVLYGGEYDNIYSDDLAKQRADFEIYQRSRLNDSISMETIPIPWMDANIVVSHRFGQKQEPSKYIVKSFSADYATGGTMTINAITWYPYYEESEVV